MSEETTSSEPILDYDIQKVLKALPHRYPLLLVDRVKRIDLGERIHAVKAVSMNEEFFQGHFPGAPIMPGVLQIEAMAQAAGILGMETLGLAGSGKLVLFMGIENAKFRAPVTPGCLLDLEVELTQSRRQIHKFS
ncbi:MAG: 3-hydroxyacyl-ACP dehydratase FabZ, partial [Pseudomonadota bacterium]